MASNSGNNELLKALLEGFYRLGPSAVFIFVAAERYFKSADKTLDNPDVRAALFFSTLGLITFGLVNFVKGIGQPVIDRFRDRLVDSLAAQVERVFLRFTSRFQSKYYSDLADIYRRYRAQGMSIAQANSLNLEQMFIPLKVAPQAYDKISPSLVQNPKGTEAYTIWDFLAASTDEPAYRRIALIAPPGAGKTVLLEHLILTYATSSRRHQNRKAPRLMPVFLSLRDIRKSIATQQPNLVSLIEQQPDIQRHKPPTGWFRDQLQAGQVLVMLDGLDEVPNREQRGQVSRWISDQIGDYRKSRFIITSRPLSYETAPITEVGTHLTLKPFGFEQIEAFAHNWYLQNAIARDPNRKKASRDNRKEAERKQRDIMRRIRKDPSLAQLALNPLMLTMILTIDDYGQKQLPLHRVDLYGEIYHVLLEKRQADRGILAADIVNRTKQVLQQLALLMMQENLTEIPLSETESPQPDLLQGIFKDDAELQLLLQKTDSASGLLVKTSENALVFVHESFRYYLAALQIRETTALERASCPPILLDNVSSSWWTETVLLYGAMVRNGSDIATAALNNGDRVSLALVNAMVQDNVPVSDAVRQQLQAKLDQGLKSSDPSVVTLATQVKLTSRLRDLRPIDLSTDIDSDYLSVAEYQLFRLANPNGDTQHPDHLQPEQLANQEAQQPIVGLRPEDARAYCDWLTETQPSDSSITKFRYRLPRPSELDTQPLQQKNQPVSAWCIQGDRYSLNGISSRWREQWERKLLAQVQSSIGRDRDRAQQLIGALKRDLPESVGLDEDAFRLPIGNHLTDAATRVADVGLDQALKFVASPIFTNEDSIPQFLTRAAQIIRNQLPLKRQLLDRTLPYEERGFDVVRAHLIVTAMLWSQLAIAYRTYCDIQNQRRFPPSYISRLLTLSQRQRYRTCRAQRDRVLELYSFFVLLEARRQGDMPAWEGIRIVRDKSAL